MLNFSISSEIFEKLPELRVGVIEAYGIEQERLSCDILGKIHQEQERLRDKLAKYESYKDFPVVKVWHEVFQKLGINPKKYSPAVENLIRITAKGINLSSINPIVDLENYIALKYLFPVGGQDLAGVKGNIRLEILKTPLPFRALGKEESKIINTQMPVYRDDEKILCIALNSKDCEEAKFTKESRDAIIFIESIKEEGALKKALEEIEKMIGKASRKTFKRILGG